MSYHLTLILACSWLPGLLTQNYAMDDDSRSLNPSSGSGMNNPDDDSSDSDSTVVYKRVKISFATKFPFQNSMDSNEFMAEVVEQLLYALNAEQGKNSHRPVMTELKDIKFSSKNSRSKRAAGGGSQEQNSSTEGGGSSKKKSKKSKPKKFSGEILIPENVDIDKLNEMLANMDFFHKVKLEEEPEKPREVFKEDTLIDFEEFRLPAKNGDDKEGVEMTTRAPSNNNNKGEDKSGSSSSNNNGGSRPVGNDPFEGKVEIDVEYQPIPEALLRDPATLAAMIAGALAGLLCTILCTVFVVYRMRKKDEGSYALDEPKAGGGGPNYKFKQEPYYIPSNKEFFA